VRLCHGLDHGFRGVGGGGDEGQVRGAGAARGGRRGRQGRQDDGGSRGGAAVLLGERLAGLRRGGVADGRAGGGLCGPWGFGDFRRVRGGLRHRDADGRAGGNPHHAASGEGRQDHGRHAEIIGFDVHALDFGGAVSVGQEQVIAGLQRSSLLFAVGPGGWGVRHLESLNSLAVRPTVYKARCAKSGTPVFPRASGARRGRARAGPEALSCPRPRRPAPVGSGRRGRRGIPAAHPSSEPPAASSRSAPARPAEAHIRP
jgi:hypothetical protein